MLQDTSIKQARLHIGAKNLIEIPKLSWNVLSHESWIHLGTQQPDFHPPKKTNDTKDEKGGLISHLKKLIKPLNNRIGTQKETFPFGGDINYKDLLIWRNSKLIPWFYRKGDPLPFDDQTFTFVYSEHFFEHLFLDEAISLFKEIFRIMTNGAVCRTVLPDADLRTYEAPEPVGHPLESMEWSNPEKHKTRWSYRTLDKILEITGFETRVLLVYCTEDGIFTNRRPEEYRIKYAQCVDTEVIFDMSYIARPKSLIVDAIKR